MPLYDYRCKACGHEFETEQRISADPLKECPECKKLELERLISKTSFRLSGGGWASDNYGSSGKKADASFGGKSNLSAEHGDKIAAGIKKSESGD